jgi:flagellar biosynthesis anti-sigma factor FlgM
MRIDSNLSAQLPAENQGAGDAAAAVKANAAVAQSVSSALGEDQAQFSGVHLQVQALVAHVLQLPETTQEKVQALRQALVSGKYQSSPDQVAGALFSSWVGKLAA